MNLIKTAIKNNKFRLQSITAGIALGICLPVAADDTEIYTGFNTIASDSNVVFVIDTSGSMGDAPLASNENRSKIQIVKDVFEKLLFVCTGDAASGTQNCDHKKLNSSLKKINLALMRFDRGDEGNNEGGYFLTPMITLNNATEADTKIWPKVNGLTDGGWTPLAETLYEAALFYGGNAPKFGATSSPATNDTGILNGTNYDTPIVDALPENQCGINNHVVLLTDGMPTEDRDADTLVNDTMDGNCGFDDGNSCLPDIASYLFNGPDGTTLPDHKKVKTHTIAFDLNETNAVTLLENTATAGGGVFKSSDNGASLAEAISQVLGKITESSSFATPSVTLSDTNRFQHDDTLYFALYKPNVSPNWEGNVKGFKMNSSGELVDFSNPSRPVLLEDEKNPGSMVFNPNAVSRWTSSGNPDGGIVARGGIVDQLPVRANRNIYTNVVTTVDDQTTESLASIANLAQDDTHNEAFGLNGNATQTDREALIQWAMGITKDKNGNTVNREGPIADPLHSAPVVVDYPDANKSIMFVGTNEGLLHAIDLSSGQEVYAYIPYDLLKNLKAFKSNSAIAGHPYGLDGPITVHRTGDKVYLIVGMRRGGFNYYVLDITTYNDPELHWRITGGTGSFTDLGQTWSKPISTKLNTGSADSPVTKDVVMFSGGYHISNDPEFDADVAANSPSGAAIYAVDIGAKEIVWQAKGNGSTSTDSLVMPSMTNSIPADLAIIDFGLDGVADRLYTVDITGQMFRIDLNNTNASNEYQPRGWVFAKLSEDTKRYFYYAPDVSIYSAGLTSYLTLSVGSGYRANPLNKTTQDRFYSLRDMAVTLPLADDYQALTHTDLANTTDTDTILNANLANGWYFNLPQREKVLSEASSISGMLFFTTYTPPSDNNVDQCVPPMGSGKLYIVGLETSSQLNNESRYVDLNVAGIPPSPSFIVTAKTGGSNDDPTTSSTSQLMVNVGTEGSKFSVSVQALKDTWEQP